MRVNAAMQNPNVPFANASLTGDPAPGTLIAASHRLPIAADAQPGRRGPKRMAIKAALFLISAALLTPAVAGFAATDRSAQPQTPRAVELSGPIVSFTQTRDRIQIRVLRTAEDSQRAIIIRATGEDDAITLRLKRGQTWVSAKLPDTLASANVLEVSVR